MNGGLEKTIRVWNPTNHVLCVRWKPHAVVPLMLSPLGVSFDCSELLLIALQAVGEKLQRTMNRVASKMFLGGSYQFICMKVAAIYSIVS